MKKTVKMLLAAILTLTLLLSAVPALAFDSFQEEGPGRYYATLPGDGNSEIRVVSTRKFLVVKDGYKEYFNFRVEDGKLILTNADGVDTEVTVDEAGKGHLELALGNGDTFTASIGRLALGYIINTGVFPIEMQKVGPVEGGV